MKIIILGGNSSKNNKWVDNIETILKKKFDDVLAHRYLHWEANNPLINLDSELQRLRMGLGNCKNYVIVAKSAGALLSLKGIFEGKLTPRACVFLGIAILWGRDKNFKIDNWLKDCSVPTLFIHNSDDPAISSEDLKNTLQKLNFKNYKLKILPGDKHEYIEFKKIIQNMESFLIIQGIN